MILSRIFGTKSEREIKKLSVEIDKINQSYELFLKKSDEDLISKTNEFKNYVVNSRLKAAEALKNISDNKSRDEKILKAEQDALDSIMTEAFAIVKVVCKRMCGESWNVSGQNVTWNMVPYNVQLLGAIILHKGKVAEMKTG
ncbi:MAG: preprotein translocase subunit SecA, partial [Candidatus Marinimicrobia bacterium]|nr:preprotein translocase subunit SecA [Candidatus Neomarinimicrobiota bacterium]